MKIDLAFWDTSAIVPLYCNQASSSLSRQWRRSSKQIVVWWGTHVEVNSSIQRLLNERIITPRQAKAATDNWTNLRSNSYIIRPDDDVLEHAAHTTGKYRIRTLDAFQLAAALVWCKEKPKGRKFVCADKRLGEAAENAGFDVKLIG